jgi:CRISPR/Cas system CSM-associated protein Csm3 (group 7 of RAMP superfamily)
MSEHTVTLPLPKYKPLVEYRFLVACRTTTPLHTGSGEAGPGTDADLRRNSQGQYVIPGTSIAGALRQVVERLAGVAHERKCRLYHDSETKADDPCGCAVCDLFGDVQPKEAKTDKLRKARASRVTVYDAAFSQPKTRIVDGVGIDRKRRAARDARKFDYRQILPDSALQIEVRGERLSQREVEWLAAALRAIATGQVGLGGRTARGNGFLKAEVNDCRITRRELHAPDQLLACVTHAAASGASWQESVADSLNGFPGKSLQIPHRVNFSFQMAPEVGSTLLISDPVRSAATGFDAAQRTLGDKPEIPGSSLAGVLRSGAERIVRTLGGRVCDPLGRRCDPKNKAKDTSLADDAWCCLPCRLFGNEDWASRLSLRVTSLGKSRHLPFDHVAIDRFTGGASDQKKFDALAVTGGMYRVDVTLDRVADRNSVAWMIGLLALVLRDLHEGRLWLGKGGSKGNGLMKLSAEPCWQLPDPWHDLTVDLSQSVTALHDEVKKDPQS